MIQPSLNTETGQKERELPCCRSLLVGCKMVQQSYSRENVWFEHDTSSLRIGFNVQQVLHEVLKTDRVFSQTYGRKTILRHNFKPRRPLSSESTHVNKKSGRGHCCNTQGDMRTHAHTHTFKAAPLSPKCPSSVLKVPTSHCCLRAKALRYKTQIRPARW